MGILVLTSTHKEQIHIGDHTVICIDRTSQGIKVMFDSTEKILRQPRNTDKYPGYGERKRRG